jgi:type I restriction enzyme S subunit
VTEAKNGAEPRGWAACPLDSLRAPEPGSFVDGPFGSNLKTEHYTNDGPRVIRLENVGDGVFRDAETHIAREHFERLRRHEARAGDVVIALLGDTVPRACVVPHRIGPAIVKADCPRLRPDSRLALSEFVAYALNSEQVRHQAKELVHGVGRPRLKLSELRGLAISLPPLPEQRRIVETLETQFSRLDVVVATLERVRANLRRHRAAVLQAAIEGKLGVPPSTRGFLPPRWQIQTLDELSDPNRPTTYGVIKLGEEVPNGVPTLRTSNVRHLRLEVEAVKRIDSKLSQEYRRTILRGGEILVAVRGTLGGVVVAPPSCAGWNVSREVAVVALRSPRLARIVALFLASPKLQSWLNSRTRGIAYTGINIATLKGAPIPVPPEEQVDRIVEATEQAITIGAAADAQIAATAARIARLRQSLLRLAFDGGLVPQDPHDEPASVLLDRIRRKHAAETSSPKKKPARSRQ